MKESEKYNRTIRRSLLDMDYEEIDRSLIGVSEPTPRDVVGGRLPTLRELLGKGSRFYRV